MNGQRQRTVATPEQLERARQNELLRQAYLIKVAERFFNEDHHITGRVQIAISFLRRPTVLPISRQTLIKERAAALGNLAKCEVARENAEVTRDLSHESDGAERFRLEGYWPHKLAKYNTYKTVVAGGPLRRMYKVTTHEANGTIGSSEYYNILPRGRLDMPEGRWAFEFPVGHDRKLKIDFGNRRALALLKSMKTKYDGQTQVPVFEHTYAGVAYEG